MSRRRQVERHRRSLGDVREIMNSMKTLAYLETRKLTGRLERQRELVERVEAAAADFLAFHPRLRAADGRLLVLVVIGTERGLCGDLNERIVRHLEEGGDDTAPAIIAVGRKLCALLEDDPRLVAAVEGANVAEEAEEVLVRLLEAVDELRDRHEGIHLSVVFLRHDPEEIVRRSLLPPFREIDGGPDYAVPPELNLSPERFLFGLVEHYLFAALNESLYASLMAENHRRVQHLEGAVRHVDERVEALRRRSNQLRQEEIIEEIEVILMGATELQAFPSARRKEGVGSER